jgi:hypothetical protein
MNACTECGSFAINHHRHGRDGSDGHLCDVCYWRARAKSAICIGHPSVIPVEDVKPLVEALSKIVKEQFYPMSKRLMTDASIAETALTNFTAKHKLL